MILPVAGRTGGKNLCAESRGPSGFAGSAARGESVRPKRSRPRVRDCYAARVGRQGEVPAPSGGTPGSSWAIKTIVARLGKTPRPFRGVMLFDLLLESASPPNVFLRAEPATRPMPKSSAA